MTDVEKNCRLCGSQASFRFKLKHATIWQCVKKGCGLQFCEPQMDDQSLAEAYSRLYYPLPKNGSRAVYESAPRSTFEQVFRNLDMRMGKSAGRTCLDFGCGNGTLCLVAREFGWSPTGIEADPQGREAASRNVGMKVYKSVNELLQLQPNAKFHLIILWQVIEHLRKPWMDLEMLRGILESDGTILIATPNAEGLKARLLGKSWDNYQNMTHFYYFTPSSLAAVLCESGFSEFERWNFGTNYEYHGFFRGMFQKVLVASELNGELLFRVSRDSRDVPLLVGQSREACLKKS